MKTVYQPENAVELLECACKPRQDETCPSISGTLIIRKDGLAFEGNADPSKITTDELLTALAVRLGFVSIRIDWPTPLRAPAPLAPRQPTTPIRPDAPAIPPRLDIWCGCTRGEQPCDMPADSDPCELACPPPPPRVIEGGWLPPRRPSLPHDAIGVASKTPRDRG